MNRHGLVAVSYEVPHVVLVSREVGSEQAGPGRAAWRWASTPGPIIWSLSPAPLWLIVLSDLMVVDIISRPRRRQGLLYKQPRFVIVPEYL